MSDFDKIHQQQQVSAEKHDSLNGFSAPLLENAKHSSSSPSEFNARFEDFNPEEEATCINQLTYLQFQPLWFYLVAPLLMVCTGLIFGLILFWFPKLRIKMFYKKTKGFELATHILVDGKMTKVEEVCPLFSSSLEQDFKDTFTFRFINFQFNHEKNKFVPVQFNTNMSYSHIINRY